MLSRLLWAALLSLVDYQRFMAIVLVAGPGHYCVLANEWYCFFPARNLSCFLRWILDMALALYPIKCELSLAYYKKLSLLLCHIASAVCALCLLQWILLHLGLVARRGSGYTRQWLSRSNACSYYPETIPWSHLFKFGRQKSSPHAHIGQ